MLCCTEPGTAFKKLYSNKGAFCNHIASNKMCLFDFFTVKRLIHTIMYVKYFVILKTLHEVSSVCTVSRRRFIVSQRRFFVSRKVRTIPKSEILQTTPVIIHQTHYEKFDWLRAFNQFTIACELDMNNAISAADIAFNVCRLVTNPLGVFSSEPKWLNASLLFLRMNYVKNV